VVVSARFKAALVACASVLGAVVVSTYNPSTAEAHGGDHGHYGYPGSGYYGGPAYGGGYYGRPGYGYGYGRGGGPVIVPAPFGGGYGYGGGPIVVPAPFGYGYGGGYPGGYVPAPVYRPRPSIIVSPPGIFIGP
jgi:hypothetical protein